MHISKLDKRLSFGSVTFTSGIQALADVLQIDKAQPDRMMVNCIVTTAAAGGTSIVIAVQGSDDNSNYATVAQSGSILLADLTLNKNIEIAIPNGWNKKYMRVAVISTGTFTAGKIEAALDTYIGA